MSILAYRYSLFINYRVFFKNSRIKMNHLKCTLLVFSAVLLTACGKNENIVGKWMQAVPGLPELKQGFVLEADGKASSVNMATLSYKAWQQEGAFP